MKGASSPASWHPGGPEGRFWRGFELEFLTFIFHSSFKSRGIMGSPLHAYHRQDDCRHPCSHVYGNPNPLYASNTAGEATTTNNHMCSVFAVSMARYGAFFYKRCFAHTCLSPPVCLVGEEGVVEYSEGKASIHTRFRSQRLNSPPISTASYIIWSVRACAAGRLCKQTILCDFSGWMSSTGYYIDAFSVFGSLSSIFTYMPCLVAFTSDDGAVGGAAGEAAPSKPAASMRVYISPTWVWYAVF